MLPQGVPEVTGQLPRPFTHNYYDLAPIQRDGVVAVTLDYAPKDNNMLRGNINFWVVDADGMRRIAAGARPEDQALASGAEVAFGPDKGKLQGSFHSSGRGEYSVILFNTSTVPASYTLQHGRRRAADAGRGQRAGAGVAVDGTGWPWGAVCRVSAESKNPRNRAARWRDHRAASCLQGTTGHCLSERGPLTLRSASTTRRWARRTIAAQRATACRRCRRQSRAQTAHPANRPGRATP